MSSRVLRRSNVNASKTVDAPNVASEVVEQDDEMYESWEEDWSDKTSEDEDSDYGQQPKAATNTRQSKKAKTNLPVTKQGQKKISLSMLPSMPLDILLEILGNLTPKDLLNVSRTSKVFHDALCNRNSKTVWTAARLQMDVPNAPEWLMEAAWAALLFGITCQSCGTKNVHNVDFLLLKRICLSCKKRNYVLRSKVEKLYPNVDFVVLDLVPSTNLSAWRSWTSTTFYYWKHDLESTMKKLNELKGAEKITFMEEQKSRVQCIKKHSSSWGTWYQSMQDLRSQELRGQEERRLLQIKERFRELDYLDEDLNGLYFEKETHGKAAVTDKVWNRIRPILEPGVAQRRTNRFEREMAAITMTRRGSLYTRYKQFKRTVQPSQWKYLPRCPELETFEPFARHIQADRDVNIDETSFEDAILQLPNLLATAAEERKSTLRTMMGGPPREEGEVEPVIDPFDLATAVFECTEMAIGHFPHLFGWDEIASHHCLREFSDRFYAFDRGNRTTPATLEHRPETANVIEKLAQLIGLDASTATPADFDRKNLRYSCDSCLPFKESKFYYRYGYTWRHLVVHLESSKVHNPQLGFMVLATNTADEVKECERNDRKWNENFWTCSHCPDYLDGRDRQYIKSHVINSHAISDPSEPTDYFFFERHKMDWKTKPRFSVPEPPPQPNGDKVRCGICNNSRVFTVGGLRDHKRAKHS